MRILADRRQQLLAIRGCRSRSQYKCSHVYSDLQGDTASRISNSLIFAAYRYFIDATFGCADDNGDWPTANATIFDVMLMSNRAVNGNLNRLAAIGALDGVELDSGHGTMFCGSCFMVMHNHPLRLLFGAMTFTPHTHFQHISLT